MVLVATSVRGEDVREGDSIVFLGTLHRVTRFEPYEGRLLALMGEGTRIAFCEGDWSITLPPSQRFEIAS